MEEVMGLVLVFVLIFLVGRAEVRKKQDAGRKVWRELPGAAKRGQSRIASDGHVISAADDISCARYGHDHSDESVQEGFPQTQFIVHDEPQEGYINLNGKILKRSEADEYMRRHG